MAYKYQVILFLVVGLFFQKASAIDLPQKLTLQSMSSKKNIEFKFNKVKETTVLFFWASWCTKCKEALAVVKQIKKMNSKVQVISISVDEVKKKARRAIQKEYRFDVKHYWSSPEAQQQLKIDQIPVIILVNKKGLIDTIYEGSYADKMGYFIKRVRYLDDEALHE